MKTLEDAPGSAEAQARHPLAIETEPTGRATTLNRLRQRQMEAVAAEEALDEIDASVAPARAAEHLAAAGFGPKLKTTADDVLARLKSKTRAGAAA